jgi:excisionase family DNA binding protein
VNGEQKITARHRNRTAVVYIRQSTMVQVRDHTESTARQYDLAQLAVQLGWVACDVVVVDQDLGVSGAFGNTRSGFRDLVSRVCLGGVGAVFGLEVSRLARSSAEFSRLLELARLTDTLVIDADGVYDLRDVNDRLLLGLKGTLSEAELHLITSRMHGAKLAAAGRGELRLPLPIGYVRDSDGGCVKDPDEQVQAAVTDLFAAFAATGSAYGVVTAFAGREFPYRVYGGAWAGQLRFRPLIHARVRHILTNPVYAGAYVYGRHRVVHRVDPDGTVRAGVRTVERAEWLVLVQDHHEGYITWASYLDNEARLAANHTRGHARPPREGEALCQGIIHCGVCGQRMSTQYKAGKSCMYTCLGTADYHHRSGCRAIAARTVDPVVEHAFLAAVAPEQIRLALAAAEEVTARHTRTHRAAELAVQRARYDADRAERAFTEVEPENRLVARTLESRWETKLAALVEAELALQRAQAAAPPVPGHDRLLAIAADLPALWRAPGTSPRDRKRLARTLIADVTVMPGPDDDHAVIGIRWHTGATSQVTVTRYGPGRTCPEALAFIRARAATTTDAGLAAGLNAAGYTTGRGRPFDATAVHRARNAGGIRAPRSTGTCNDGELTVKQVAARFDISISAVYEWIYTGKLPAHRTRAGRWHIPFDDHAQARCRDLVTSSAHLGRPNRTFEVLDPGEVTVSDLAARLGIGTTAVLGWIRTGQLQARRTPVEHHWRIRFDDQVLAHCQDLIAASARLSARHHGGLVACQGERTIRQIGQHLGISRGAVLSWIYSGKIEAHQTTQGYWHIPWNPAVEAHCRQMTEKSPNLRRKPRTQRTDAESAV